MLSAQNIMRYVKAGDPLWELEMTIENFPLDQGRDYSNPVPEEEEWGLFKHAMRNAIAVEDKRPEIRSRIKAAMLLWNRYAGHKVWKEVDVDYKDVEPWERPLALTPGLFPDIMGKKLIYKDTLKRANEFTKKLDEIYGREEYSTTVAGDDDASPKKEAEKVQEEEEEEPVAFRTRNKARVDGGRDAEGAASSKKQKAQDDEAVASRTRNKTNGGASSSSSSAGAGATKAKTKRKI